jgi:urease accessory protein UreE
MLQVFKPLHVAREVNREESLPPSATSYLRDTITLGWEERMRARGRRRTDSGLEFGTALARGKALHAGDCFILDELSTVVVVVERDEPVFVVEPAGASQWALFAYHIGNSHQPVMITNEAIVCADVPGMEQVLQYHAIPFTRAVRPFTPVGLADGYFSHRHRP